MFEAILNGFMISLQPTSLLTILVGTFAGLVIGALPGLSAVSGVALLLPFTFSMDPAQGLLMLAAVYMSAEYGGSISAILINTPGTSGAACTMLDGHPLTQQGRAQDALYTSLLASTVGGMIGAVILLFFTPALAQASLLLGPAEMFWIAGAGLALVASLSGQHTIKGLIGALIGVGMTLVGQDLITGDMRFTFDNYRLVGGIPLVPALLGLFAVANILSLLEQPHRPIAPLNIRPGALREAVSRLLGMKRLLIWSGTLGAVIGAIPGAGASIGAFVSYGEAMRLSKSPETFGKGNFEGVAAPEAANNGVVGGAMVPLLSLGIPGSGSAAVMFGALTVHGILPGPRLFTERADLVYTFMTGFFFTVFAMVAIGLLSIRWSSLVVKAPRKAMVPAVLILSMVGTYGLANSLFDVYVLLGVGFIGYLLAKIDVPPVTIALGLVLGHIMEQNFQRATIVGPIEAGTTLMYFLTRPLSLLLMLLAFGILLTGILQILRGRRLELGPEFTEEAIAAEGISLRAANIILGLVLTALCAYVLLEAQTFSPQAALFPRIVALSSLLLAGILVVVNANPRTGRRRMAGRPYQDVPWFVTLLIAVGLLLVAVLSPFIGFYEGAFLFIASVYWMLSSDVSSNGRRAVGAVIFAGVFTAICYVIFKLVLEIATPSGFLV